MKESTKRSVFFPTFLKENVGNFFKLKTDLYIWDTDEKIEADCAICLIVSAKPTVNWNASVVGFNTSYRDYLENSASSWPVQVLFNGKHLDFLLYDDLIEIDQSLEG